MNNGKQGEQLLKVLGGHTVLAWTEQVKRRGLSEQPNYNRVATKPCNMKLVIGITLISVNHHNSTALERSVINNWGAASNSLITDTDRLMCSLTASQII